MIYNTLSSITWNVDPVIFYIKHWGIRWYGLLLAIGFLLSYIVLGKTMLKEGFQQKIIDKFSIYIIVGTIIGLRLGHCLFYEPEFYLSKPIEFFKVWKGGLASHGGALGILIAIFIFSKLSKLSYLGMLDKVVMIVPLAGGMVRLGNLMNHEIYGHSTNLPWGFKFIINLEGHFLKGEEVIYSQVSHPTQIYEALFYFIMFVSLYFVYKKFHENWKNGTFLGIFLIILFGFRFFIEFIKENQSSFEDNMIIDMGQLLSIPFVILGISLVIRQFTKTTSKKLK